jgi:crossover junction endodeoxyribonuclease RuvC
MRVLGIDPGLNGAGAVIEDATIKQIIRFPLKEVKVNNKRKRVLDIEKLVAVFCELVNIDYCYIEQVNAMPGQGTVSMFSFGRTFGITETAVIAAKIKLNYVHPKTWQKAVLGPMTEKGKSKEYALETARSLFPKENLKHNGIIDAVLIALYGYRIEREKEYKLL